MSIDLKQGKYKQFTCDCMLGYMSCFDLFRMVIYNPSYVVNLDPWSGGMEGEWM